MKILSFDVGIKNLAYCLFEINDKEVNILKWDIINLCNTSKKCNFCIKEAKYVKQDKYYCTNHAKKEKLDKNFLNYHKEKKENLIKLLQKLNIEVDKKEKKENILKILDDNNDKFFKKIESINANDIPLLNVGIAIKNEFVKHFQDYKIDKVLIENQISKIANRMKTIQGMIMEYFIIQNVEEVYFISSINKLKLLTNEQKNTDYKERKKLSIELCKTLLHLEKDILFFNKHKKKDDLADCFLQGCYYIKENNLGQIVK
tara:strand:+ start:3872 stop:4648 length:777 start_codon:yes stop_codon:yes gene_type:complete